MTATTTPFAVATEPQRHYPNADHPNELDPLDVPDVYASVCKGDCLTPVFPDGECLVFSKIERPEAGDYVGIWLRPDIAGDDLPRRVKRLRMGLPPFLSLPLRLSPDSNAVPIIELEQHNPPMTYLVPADHILAMHKVIGTAVQNGDGTANMLPVAARGDGA